MSIVPAVALTAIFTAITALAVIHHKRHPTEILPCHPQKLDALSIDAVSKLLDAAQADASEKDLDWRSGIVDLQKLLGNDSSKAGRAELWAYYGQPGVYAGSAAQNVELHKLVMEEIAKGAIKVPT